MSLLVVHIPLTPITYFMVFIFVSLGPALFQYSRHVRRQNKEDVYMIKIFAICWLCYYSCLPSIHLEVMILDLNFTLSLSSVFSVLCLNSVLIYFSEKLWVLNVLHPVCFGIYTRLHILPQDC